MRRVSVVGAFDAHWAQFGAFGGSYRSSLEPFWSHRSQLPYIGPRSDTLVSGCVSPPPPRKSGPVSGFNGARTHTGLVAPGVGRTPPWPTPPANPRMGPQNWPKYGLAEGAIKDARKMPHVGGYQRPLAWQCAEKGWSAHPGLPPKGSKTGHFFPHRQRFFFGAGKVARKIPPSRDSTTKSLKRSFP